RALENRAPDVAGIEVIRQANRHHPSSWRKRAFRPTEVTGHGLQQLPEPGGLSKRGEVRILLRPLPPAEAGMDASLESIERELLLTEQRVYAGNAVQHGPVLRVERQRTVHPLQGLLALIQSAELGGATVPGARVIGVEFEVLLQDRERASRGRVGLHCAPHGFV